MVVLFLKMIIQEIANQNEMKTVYLKEMAASKNIKHVTNTPKQNIKIILMKDKVLKPQSEKKLIN